MEVRNVPQYFYSVSRFYDVCCMALRSCMKIAGFTYTFRNFENGPLWM